MHSLFKPLLDAGRRYLLGRDSRVDQSSNRKNMQQLIHLRWLAVLGQLATIGVVHFGLHITLALHYMLAVLAGLVIFNGISLLRLRIPRRISNREMFAALLVDVLALTIQLYLSGGATNPFIFLYLLQLSLAAVLLPTRSTWWMLALTILCFVGLALVSQPLDLPLDHTKGLSSLYIQGMLICFVLNATLFVLYIKRIGRNIRARDAHLADLRQRASEARHIVRMGLLASGAAHELSTPLSILAVILGDWQHMPVFSDDPDLQQEITMMQTQILRCKSIVSDILLSAGEARGETLLPVTVCSFFDGLAQEWRSTRPVAVFDYQNHFGADLNIIADSTLKQMVCNVLDNALEASPGWVSMELHRVDQDLQLVVQDRGPGFTPDTLAHLGTPYQSSKGRPGAGLGLFLVLNVARALGGHVTACNRAQGGAMVTLTVPLVVMTQEELRPYA